MPYIGEPVRFIHPDRPTHPYYSVGCVEKQNGDKLHVVTRKWKEDRPNPITDRTDETVVINVNDLR